MSFEETIRQIVREENEEFLQKIKDELNYSAHDSMPDVLTVQEAAEYLRMGKSKMYELSQHHDFPSWREGRRVLISKKGLDQYQREKLNEKEVIM
ncbi:helix-turn-helix domain-containing protein [Shouchella hunanensis]|uniref:Helix-turn-helix domain-containing protein n=1 Tax=Shouchella hunanensis TaxID=766894 RepID=A0ABY7WCZ7_9BACI|nr:helix-turn-helix domain-containing protein [Shouchella hunanensis]WDF05518.1 helix-turn-helix domain-containing protein [Shouchella hunanensis]